MAGVTLPVATTLRFLGVMVTADGRFAPWRDSFDAQLYSLQHRLAGLGLGSLPLALKNGLFVSIMPSLLFGSELWGIDELYAVMFRQANPFDSTHLRPIIQYIRNWIGLSKKSSLASIHRFLAFPSFTRLVLPRLAKLLSTVSAD